MQMYADSTDFTGLPDPSMNNVVAPSTANEDDGDQYVARQLRANLEALFASNNVRLPALPSPYSAEYVQILLALVS